MWHAIPCTRHITWPITDFNQPSPDMEIIDLPSALRRSWVQIWEVVASKPTLIYKKIKSKYYKIILFNHCILNIFL